MKQHLVNYIIAGSRRSALCTSFNYMPMLSSILIAALLLEGFKTSSVIFILFAVASPSFSTGSPGAPSPSAGALALAPMPLASSYAARAAFSASFTARGLKPARPGVSTHSSPSGVPALVYVLGATTGTSTVNRLSSANCIWDLATGGPVVRTEPGCESDDEGAGAAAALDDDPQDEDDEDDFVVDAFLLPLPDSDVDSNVAPNLPPTVFRSSPPALPPPIRAPPFTTCFRALCGFTNRSFSNSIASLTLGGSSSKLRHHTPNPPLSTPPKFSQLIVPKPVVR